MERQQSSFRSPIAMSATGRIYWTTDLHSIFVQAIQKLGRDASPLTILKEMNVEGLSRQQVSSHWQKYRKDQEALAKSQSVEEPMDSTEKGEEEEEEEQPEQDSPDNSDQQPCEQACEPCPDEPQSRVQPESRLKLHFYWQFQEQQYEQQQQQLQQQQCLLPYSQSYPGTYSHSGASFHHKTVIFQERWSLIQGVCGTLPCASMKSQMCELNQGGFPSSPVNYEYRYISE